MILEPMILLLVAALTSGMAPVKRFGGYAPHLLKEREYG
jgi:hypothetical protein